MLDPRCYMANKARETEDLLQVRGVDDMLQAPLESI